MKGKRGGKWHGSGVLRTIRNQFHKQRNRFPKPKDWGEQIWQRR